MTEETSHAPESRIKLIGNLLKTLVEPPLECRVRVLKKGIKKYHQTHDKPGLFQSLCSTPTTQTGAVSAAASACELADDRLDRLFTK